MNMLYLKGIYCTALELNDFTISIDVWSSTPVLDLSMTIPAIEKTKKEFSGSSSFTSSLLHLCTYHFVCPSTKCLHSPIACHFIVLCTAYKSYCIKIPSVSVFHKLLYFYFLYIPAF